MTTLQLDLQVISERVAWLMRGPDTPSRAFAAASAT
jgi:hypothetical protein